MKKHTNSIKYKSLTRKLDHLEHVHEHDLEVLKQLRFAKHAIEHSKSAFNKIDHFFQTERDLLGIHDQSDRDAFFRLCEKIKDEDPDVPELERRIETPQRTHIRREIGDDGLTLERKFHLFSGRSREQEEHEHDLKRKREQALEEERQRHRDNETIQELNRAQARTINFVGPFNTVAEHEKYIRQTRFQQSFRDVHRQRGPSRGRSRGPDMGMGR